MPVNDGGPAFPTQLQDDKSQITCDAGPGMSLRDYFAGQVIAGWMASCTFLKSSDTIPKADRFAHLAYVVADAMLKERGR